MKHALVTGITGQDGPYLARLLLAHGYRVYGVVRNGADVSDEHVRAELRDVELLRGDLAEQRSLTAAVDAARPDEVYNLGAISSIPLSWARPEATFQITGGGPLRVLEAIRIVGGEHGNPIRFFQASSSEMFGRPVETPQNELTPLRPRSPYGAAKTYAHHVTQSYRERYGIFAVSGILFNHESPRRGLEFVSRKIAHGVARIALGLQDELHLGNLDATRDWGFAGDYVAAMWRMLAAADPDDYVVGTGVARSVRELVGRALAVVGVAVDWSGSGLDEQGRDRRSGRTLVRVDRDVFRAGEAATLVADPAKARERLGWTPTLDFDELVRLMVEAELEREATPAPRGRRSRGGPAQPHYDRGP